jgi:predicted membrane protein
MRAASLSLAMGASVIGLVCPFLLARQPTGLNQTILLAMMAGIAGAFIYGAGFWPKAVWARFLISPALCWSLLLGSLGLLVWLR